MKLVTGRNMWDAFDAHEHDIMLITANSTIKMNGALVMGRGAALEARDRFYGIDLVFGTLIVKSCGSGGRYGVLISDRWERIRTKGLTSIGLFQVKKDYKKPASLFLIQEAVDALNKWCEKHPGASVGMNYPGIGSGKLGVSEVEPYLAGLSDQVTVYKL